MKSIKMEQMVSMDRLPDVLEQLAEGLRGQGVQAGLLGNLSLGKMKLQVENVDGQALVKLSVKPQKMKKSDHPNGNGTAKGTEYATH